MVQMQPGDWLTVAQTAEVLGLTVARVHAFIKSGRLQSTRAGTQYLLLRSDVEAFKKLPRTPGRPAAAKRKPPAKRKGR